MSAETILYLCTRVKNPAIVEKNRPIRSFGEKNKYSSKCLELSNSSRNRIKFFSPPKHRVTKICFLVLAVITYPKATPYYSKVYLNTTHFFRNLTCWRNSLAARSSTSPLTAAEWTFLMSFISCGIESRNFRILAWAEVCLTSKCPMPSQTTFSSLAKSWSWIQILMLVLWTSIPKQWYLWYYSCLSIQNAKVNTTNVTISKYLLFLCGFGQRVESWNWHIILMDEFLCKFHNEIIQPFLNLNCAPKWVKCVSQHINY